MPLDNDQFAELLKKAMSAASSVASPPELPKVQSKIDKAIPLPIGSKTIIGILGTVLSTGFVKLGGVTDPNILMLLDWAVAAFASLAGVGAVAKVDRFIKIALQVLVYAPEVVTTLQRIEQQLGERR